MSRRDERDGGRPPGRSSGRSGGGRSDGPGASGRSGGRAGASGGRSGATGRAGPPGGRSGSGGRTGSGSRSGGSGSSGGHSRGPGERSGRSAAPGDRSRGPGERSGRSDPRWSSAGARSGGPGGPSHDRPERPGGRTRPTSEPGGRYRAGAPQTPGHSSSERPRRSDVPAGPDRTRRPERYPEADRDSSGRPRPEDRPARYPSRPEPDTPDSESLVWGRRPVLEALRAGRPVHRLQVLATGEGLSRELFELAREAQIPVVRCDRFRLDALSRGGNHQGVVAQLAEREYASFQEVLERAGSGSESLFLLVLDGIQDPGNLGALLRTAEAAGVGGVVVSSRRSCPLSAAVSKAAAGADMHLPIARVDRLDKALAELRASGVLVVAAVPGADTLYTELDYTGPVVLVLGSEGEGLDRAVAKACQGVGLPMRGRTGSLNVSACGAAMLYEVVRQRLTR